MAKDKQYLPQSTAGLIRYFDEETSIKIKPQHVIWLTMFFISIVLVMKFMAA
jgi:preprotein translocase subunit Sec61beta